MFVEKIKLERANRMIRIGFGLYMYIPFFRIDLWYYGFRITKLPTPKRMKSKDLKNMRILNKDESYDIRFGEREEHYGGEIQ
tara:strand:- start:752 stop:997 length:246 start_codon:yes stop_codon:yes gene_type:complete